MKKILTILILFVLCKSVVAQTVPPSPYTSMTAKWYKFNNYVSVDSVFFLGIRDTSVIPFRAGAVVVWQHAGVDTVAWLYDGHHWKQMGTSGGGSGGSGVNIYNSDSLLSGNRTVYLNGHSLLFSDTITGSNVPVLFVSNNQNYLGYDPFPLAISQSTSDTSIFYTANTHTFDGNVIVSNLGNNGNRLVWNDNTGLLYNESMQVVADSIAPYLGFTPSGDSTTLYYVLDSTCTIPGSPVIDDAYMVCGSPTGAWAGHPYDIATWDGAAWVFTTPHAGNNAYITQGVNAGRSYIYRSSMWQRISGIPVLVGGNKINSELRVGTLDARALSLLTNNNVRLQINNAGEFRYFTLQGSGNTFMALNSTGVASRWTGSTGSIPYFSTTNIISNLAAGTNGQHLVLSGGLPVWRDTTAIPSAWLLTGNSGTTPGTNFVGTTDQQNLIFKVNNVQAGLLTWDGNDGNTAFGANSFESNVSGVQNTAVGNYALEANTIGQGNVAVGNVALLVNTTGTNNVAIGYGALGSNESGSFNIALGTGALQSTSASDSSVAIGIGTLTNMLTGNNIVAIGSSVDVNTQGLRYSIGLGSGAIIRSSHQVSFSDSLTTIYFKNLDSATGTAPNVVAIDASGNWHRYAAASGGVTTFSAGTTGFTPNSATSGAVTLAGVLELDNGGTNANLTASNGGIFYSTATAGAILSGTATANKMLLSGATAAPTWSTSTIPSSAGATANKVLLSDGTNYVLSTPTFPNASATTGKIIISDGTNWIASTPTYPSAAGTSGNILTSDGTNWTSAAPAAPTGAWLLASGGTLTGTNTITTGSNPIIFSMGVTTGTGATAGHQVVANSLTTGNAVDISSSSVTSGNIVSISSTSTAAASNTQTGLKIALSGTNVTSSQFTYGLQVSNTHAGSGTNVGGYFTSSGGSNNPSIMVDGESRFRYDATNYMTITPQSSGGPWVASTGSGTQSIQFRTPIQIWRGSYAGNAGVSSTAILAMNNDGTSSIVRGIDATFLFSGTSAADMSGIYSRAYETVTNPNASTTWNGIYGDAIASSSVNFTTAPARISGVWGKVATGLNGTSVVFPLGAAVVGEITVSSPSSVNMTAGYSFYAKFNGNTASGGKVVNYAALRADSADQTYYSKNAYFLDGRGSNYISNIPGKTKFGDATATAPTAKIHIAAGTATANTSPLKLTTGTSLTVAEAGAIEYTTPQLFFTNDGGQRQELFQGQQSRVSTQFDKTNDVSLANITGLTATLVAGKTYRFTAKLFTTSNVGGGVQFAIGGTATATNIIYDGLTTDAGLTTQGRGTALATAVGAVTAVTAASCVIAGTITVNAAGTLTVQFAQNASNGTASSVLVGSTFVVTEMP